MDDLGQVCTLSRQGISAFLPPLSASLQDSLRFLPVPLPPREFSVTHVPLTVEKKTTNRPHGAYLVPSTTHL